VGVLEVSCSSRCFFGFVGFRHIVRLSSVEFVRLFAEFVRSFVSCRVYTRTVRSSFSLSSTINSLRFSQQNLHTLQQLVLLVSQEIPLGGFTVSVWEGVPGVVPGRTSELQNTPRKPSRRNQRGGFAFRGVSRSRSFIWNHPEHHSKRLL
jgi:hypothetical protein